MRDFAVFSKSFHEDLFRSISSYKSFLRFFEEKDVPYYISVPKADVKRFRLTFQFVEALKIIRRLPTILSDEDLLSMAQMSPHLTRKMRPYYLQQGIKLAFGLTNLATNYLVIDPDGYFTKRVSKSYFTPPVEDGMDLSYFFHETWHAGFSFSNLDSRNELGHGDEDLKARGVRLVDAMKLVKSILNSKDIVYRNYISSPSVFNSACVQDLHHYLSEEYSQDFSWAISQAPFEFQWYGEWIFSRHCVKSLPHMLHIVDPRRRFLWKLECKEKCGHVGVQYQSVVYSDSGARRHNRVRPIIFRR